MNGVFKILTVVRTWGGYTTRRHYCKTHSVGKMEKGTKSPFPESGKRS